MKLVRSGRTYKRVSVGTRRLKDGSGCCSCVIRLVSLCDMIDYLVRRRFLMDSDDLKVVDTLDIRGEGTTRPSGIGFEIRYNFEDNFEIATLRG